MLNIGKLRHGGESYYLDTVAQTVESYYTGSGEAPGRWCGRGIERLGLVGEVDATTLRQVLRGEHPQTCEELAGPQRTIPGFDLTFRAPKSVSLVWALSDAETTVEVRRAHDAAVTAALDYLERQAAFTRRGKGGAEQVPVDGFVAAAFPHRTSRADDPLLHTHVLVANLAHTDDDGKWRTLDARHLYLHAKTAGYLYQSHLRHELTDRLQVRWGPVRNGYADLDGVPRDVIETFSRRRSEILAELDRLGHTSASAAQVATLATRAPKHHHDQNPEGLRERWRRRADGAGFDDEAVAAVTGRDRPAPPGRAELRRHADGLLGPAGLTAQASTFTRRDTIQGWCLRLPTGAPVGRVERLADHLLHGTGSTVRLTGPATEVASLAAAGIRLRDGRLVATGETRWSTPELLAIEQRLVDTAIQGRGAGVAVVPDAVVERIVAARGWLAEEQAAAVRRLCGDGDGVAVVVGRAGSGKTSMLGVAREAWDAAAVPVIGVALAARAALELGRGAGIDATTIERLLIATSHPGGGLPPGGVLVIDEAGMVGTRTLARLVDLATAANAKVVMVGDHHQLPEIDAGGTFAGLANRLPAIELNDNRRQRAAWEIAALDDLRDGDIPTAVDTYGQHDRLAVGDTIDAVREELVGDWWQATGEHGTDAIMIAARKVDIDDLNRRARNRLAQAGTLTGPTIEVAGRQFQVGDLVLCLRNHRSVGVLNGTRATVTRIDTDTRAITVERDDTHDEVLLPAEYLDAGWVDHGYALTAHKAQGLTCEATFVLADDATYREWGYVAMSRGRTDNRLYLVNDPTDPDPIDDPVHPEVLQTDTRPADLRLVTDLQRSNRQALALDHLADDSHSDQTGDLPPTGAEPPSYLSHILGSAPAAPTSRQVWAEAVAAVEGYRASHGITDTAQPLGPRPPGPADSDEYGAVLHQLILARRQLTQGPAEPATQTGDVGMALG